MRKWKVEDIREVLRQTGEEMGMSCELIPIEISTRMRRGLGYFEFYVNGRNYLAPIKFKFSSRLLTDGYTDEEITLIIKHEYCHFYANETYSIDCKHNAYFKEACKKAGISPKATIDSKAFVESAYKWNVVCDKCGVLGQYKRRKDLSGCVCAKCLSTIYLKEIV